MLSSFKQLLLPLFAALQLIFLTIILIASLPVGEPAFPVLLEFFDFLIYFCATMVLAIRDDLLQANDFAFAVKALQRYENRVPMHALLAKAVELYRADHPAREGANAAGEKYFF